MRRRGLAGWALEGVEGGQKQKQKQKEKAKQAEPVERRLGLGCEPCERAHTQALEDGSVGVRYFAALALAGATRPESVAALKRLAIEDPDPEVRRAAREALR